MAHNFKISLNRNSNNLHVKLSGDFDGSSAHELLRVLRKNCRGTSRVIIHTSSLKHIHPFGRHVFRNNLDVINRQSVLLLYTGEKAIQLAPEGSKLWRGGC